VAEWKCFLLPAIRDGEGQVDLVQSTATELGREVEEEVEVECASAVEALVGGQSNPRPGGGPCPSGGQGAKTIASADIMLVAKAAGITNRKRPSNGEPNPARPSGMVCSCRDRTLEPVV